MHPPPGEQGVSFRLASASQKLLFALPLFSCCMLKERTDRHGNSAVEHRIFDGRWRSVFEPATEAARDNLRNLATRVSEFVYSTPQFQEVFKQRVVHGFVPDRSVLTHAKTHQTAQTIVQMDLYRAFEFTRRARVITTLDKLGAPAQLQQEVSGKAFFFDLLPAGFPTSPILFTTAMLPADQELMDFAARQGFAYSRYVDDLAFSSQRPWIEQTEIDAAREILKSHGYDTHKVRAEHPTTKRALMCGVGIYKGRLLVPGKVKRDIRSGLHHALAENPEKLVARMGGLLGRVTQVERRVPGSLGKYKEAFLTERYRQRQQRRWKKRK